MSVRKDIVDGLSYSFRTKGLIYTKILGWIDLGHARGADMKRLKKVLYEEKGRKFFPKLNEWYFPVDYYQEMAYSIKNTDLNIWGGIHSPLMVRSCLSDEMKKRVALTIMMKIAWRFEAFQDSSLINWKTDSGFSGEDLVSDLVGFYRVFGSDIDVLMLAQPARLTYALSLWDHYGPIGSFKNHGFRPLLFPKPCPPKKSLPRFGSLPSWLDYIRPLGDLSNKYISNRYLNVPVKDFFADKNRLNGELYTSLRKGFEFRDKPEMPSHFNYHSHHPAPPDYFHIGGDNPVPIW
ncbi:hypothetical protein [Rahnella laticis]|uniref:hypothetical protein n=1 Tax=Rahnella laticis TaxID=2787622 RepID=UPI0018A3078B|nr:hypothetical protein [Rahnella laticis]MBF7993636.1 hypothetical protein [Rahnella laticis]